MEDLKEVNWSQICREAIEKYIDIRSSVNPKARAKYLEMTNKERAAGWAYGTKLAEELTEILDYDAISDLMNEILHETDDLKTPGQDYELWLLSPLKEYTEYDEYIEQEAKTKGSLAWLLWTNLNKPGFDRNWTFIKAMYEALLEVFS